MSYDIYAKDADTYETIRFTEPHHLRGGTYQVGGCPLAHLNITYNYSPWFRKFLGKEGIRAIYGLSMSDALPMLRDARDAMSSLTENPADYWEATEGNARKSIVDLIELGEMCPRDATWSGD